MASQAKLYEVEGQHGTIYVYALHEPQTGMLWTERTEKAARSLADEKKLTIIEQLTISRRELLRLMGQEPPEETPPAPRPAATFKQQTRLTPGQSNAPTGGSWAGCKMVPGGSSLPLTETPLTDDEIVVAQAPKGPQSLFCSSKPAAQEEPLDQTDEDEGLISQKLPPQKP